MTRSMSLTVPRSRARDLNSSCSPARTVRSCSWLLDDLEALGDLVLVRARAVAAQQELAHVGRDRVLALELQGQVLADDAARERLGCEPIERVELHQPPPPMVTVSCAITRPSSSSSHEERRRVNRIFVHHEDPRHALGRQRDGPREQRGARIARLAAEVDVRSVRSANS